MLFSTEYILHLFSGGKESFRKETTATVSCSTLPQRWRVTQLYAKQKARLRTHHTENVSGHNYSMFCPWLIHI
jgi:hypothetical protein